MVGPVFEAPVLATLPLLAASLVCMGRPLEASGLVATANATHPTLRSADGALALLEAAIEGSIGDARRRVRLPPSPSPSKSGKPRDVGWSRVVRVSLRVLREG